MSVIERSTSHSSLSLRAHPSESKTDEAIYGKKRLPRRPVKALASSQ